MRGCRLYNDCTVYQTKIIALVIYDILSSVCVCVFSLRTDVHPGSLPATMPRWPVSIKHNLLPTPLCPSHERKERKILKHLNWRVSPSITSIHPCANVCVRVSSLRWDIHRGVLRGTRCRGFQLVENIRCCPRSCEEAMKITKERFSNIRSRLYH